MLDLGPIRSVDELQVMHPTVVHDGDGYRMCYAANSFVVPHTVAMATSPDGIHWTKHRDGEPVRGLGWYVTGSAVIPIADEYLMLCSPEYFELNQCGLYVRLSAAMVFSGTCSTRVRVSGCQVRISNSRGR